jgi:hypothetical protein
MRRSYTPHRARRTSCGDPFAVRRNSIFVEGTIAQCHVFWIERLRARADPAGRSASSYWNLRTENDPHPPLAIFFSTGRYTL